MNDIRRAVGVALVAATVAAPGIGGQERGRVLEAYFRAVAEHFGLPSSEVSILGDWSMPEEEIPVVLFLANHAGVSPEAIVALRRSGRSWGDLARRYEVDASQFYVPIPDGAAAGVLQSAYDRYRASPTPSWAEVPLSDRDIVSLVNLRVISQTLGLAPERVLASARGGSWIDVYGRLLGEPDDSRSRAAA